MVAIAEESVPDLPVRARARPVEVLFETERTRVSRVWLPDAGGSVIRKEPLGSGSVGRARHELRILGRLDDVWGVVRLVAGRADDELLLDDLHGESLAVLIREQQPDISTCLEIVLELTRIVGAVHRAGVVHKDINPSNIVLSGPQHQPVLIDFDLASTFTAERPVFAHHREIVGTLPYLAPEQTGRTGMTVDARADLYSVGATIYELATGEPPFATSDPLQMVYDAVARVPVAPTDRDARVPRQLSDIVMRLLEKEPDDRYQSAEGLAHDLCRLRDGLAGGRHERFALGERDFPLRMSAPSRLVGRDAEIGALKAAFENALAGEGRGVFVAGAPGVGKTALVDGLRSVVTARGGWFVSGKFDQNRQDAGSDAVWQAMRALGRLLLAGTESELAETRERIASTVGRNIDLAAAVPEFAALLGIDPGADPVGAASGDAREAAARLQQAGVDALCAIASPQRPVVIVVDDLQWAGAVPVGFLDAVLNADEKLSGVLLVGIYRDAEIDSTHPLTTALARWEHLDAAPTLVRLDNLPPTDLSELLGDMLRVPSQAAADLTDAVGARTGGNPYDTVELVNTLRRDGALVAGQAGWTWNAATIRRFVGNGSVVDLLSARIDQLPGQSQALSETMACLGGDMELDLVVAASGLAVDVVKSQLLAPLEDGLLVLEHGDPQTVRFRHDRVQQAAYSRLEPARRRDLHLAIARRLATARKLGAVAAEQYLQSVDAVQHRDETRVAAALFVDAAATVRVLNMAAAERYLTAAVALLEEADAAPGDPLLVAAERQRHAVLYSLGRLDDADTVYVSIELYSDDPIDLVKPACVQVASLTNRGQPRAAVTLGMALLGRLGMDVPEGDFAAGAEQRSDQMASWVSALVLADELARPETENLRVRRASTLIHELLPASFFCDPAITAWLIQASQRLWAEHGPSAPLVANLSSAIISTIALRDDYRTGYVVAKHALAIGEARGYEPETSYARHISCLMTRHWFEPLEDGIQPAQLAREGLVRGGDVQMACFTDLTSMAALLDCSPSLESCAADVEPALALASRTGNDHAIGSYLAYRQLLKALRGVTATPGSFSDDSFDETEHLAGLGKNTMAAAYFHVYRALSATLFGDTPSLTRNAAAAISMIPHIVGFYPVALAHVFQGLALAELVRTAPPGERPALLAELDSCRDWLATRATDAPVNFGHLSTLLTAERAWAIGDAWEAARAFDDARREVATRARPWQRALITERAALFHLANGFNHAGRELLGEAKRQYGAWGATAKVRQLDEEHAFLRAVGVPQHGGTSHVLAPASSSISADEIDMLAILRTSQALSSETSLDRLRARLGELLSALTGATKVLIALRPDDSDDWLLWDTTGGSADAVPVVEAAAMGLLPLSVLRYAERTGEPLLIEDAAHDDRFAHDPYVAGLERCSLLVVPIVSNGALRAVLMLENRMRKGAFAADRLDAVVLVTGQLTVSLDNAQLYASLERKVAERTVALEEANRTLETLSQTDALTGLPNRRHFDATFGAEWRRAVRQANPLCLAMIDIDDFKLYNDRYGHVAGDECLRLVANAFRDGLRCDTDVVCRYGGEEFAAIMPGMDEAGGLLVAERIRSAVTALRHPHGGSGTGIVTVSIGLAAHVPGASTTADELIAIADAGVYEAKANGRNQVRAAWRRPVDSA